MFKGSQNRGTPEFIVKAETCQLIDKKKCVFMILVEDSSIWLVLNKHNKFLTFLNKVSLLLHIDSFGPVPICIII